MKVIKNIEITSSDEFDIDVDHLYETLLFLPADAFIKLFKKMYGRIYGFSPLSGYGGCHLPEDDV